MTHMFRMALLCVLTMAVDAAPALAQDQVFFVVRHAERADASPAQVTRPVPMKGPDPGLSPEGHARAKRLAEMLRDTGVAQIITTEYLRTKQTAAPLAQRLNLQPVTAPENVGALIDRLRSETRATLVIGHSNTVPQILNGLGVPAAITLGEHDYDDLFIVVRHPSGAGAATLIRMKY